MREICVFKFSSIIPELNVWIIFMVNPHTGVSPEPGSGHFPPPLPPPPRHQRMPGRADITCNHNGGLEALSPAGFHSVSRTDADTPGSPDLLSMAPNEMRDPLFGGKCGRIWAAVSRRLHLHGLTCRRHGDRTRGISADLKNRLCRNPCVKVLPEVIGEKILFRSAWSRGAAAPHTPCH